MTYRRECKKRRNGPADQREWNLERLYDQSILSDSRGDRTDEELEDARKKVSKDL
jgi:hypothetical protein